MHIVVICRFSLLGRCDWQAYRGKADEEIEDIALEQAEILYAPERMEARLASFEHITLASIAAQTDKRFHFLVLASEFMPEQYRARLDAMCARVPQVILRYFPMITAGDALKLMLEKMNINLADTVQFRLDDDDGLFVNYVQRLRHFSNNLSQVTDAFSLSFSGVLFSVVGGEFAGSYHWPVAFFSAGAAMRHPRATIFTFGHFGLQHRMTSLTVPGRLSLATHTGNNDTQEIDFHTIRRRGMRLIEPAQLETLVQRDFPYLTAEGRAIAGLPAQIAAAAE